MGSCFGAGAEDQTKARKEPPTNSAPGLPRCVLPRGCAVHGETPWGFSTAAFIPPTTAPGPSGTPSLLHKPTTAALGPALPYLLPQPGPAQTFRRSPVPTWCTLAGITGHPRTERGPGLRVSPGSLPKPSQWTRSPPLVPTRHRGGGSHPRSTLVGICCLILRVRN